MEQEFFASCLMGLESALADELRSYEIKRVRPLNGGVAFYGTAQDAYRACLWSRLASRIVLVLARVSCENADALYKGVSDIAWESLLLPGASIGVHASGTNEDLRNSRFTALKTKDAIVDRLRESGTTFPVVRDEAKRAYIDVRVHAHKATISLDLSGEALNHRWYLLPEDSNDAAYRCSLAAGALACSGCSDALSDGATLLETGCRDGILLIEAASISCDLAPGLARTKWGFEGWTGYDEDSFDLLRQEAEDRFASRIGELLGTQIQQDLQNQKSDEKKIRFIGLSVSSPSISHARKQIRQAGLRSLISVELGDSSDCARSVERLQGRGRPLQASQQEKFLPCVVGAQFDSSHEGRLAQAQAERRAFLAAIRAVKGTCLSFAINGPDLAFDFPAQSIIHFDLGQGRARTTLDVFTSAPLLRPAVRVIDLQNGSEHEVEVSEANSEQFSARFRKMFKERRKWAAQNGVSCYRIYDADLPDYAVAIDWYEGAGKSRGNSYLHIAEYAAPASVDPHLAQRRFDDVLTLAPLICGIRPDHVFSKQRTHDKGGKQYAQVGKHSYVTTVAENGHLIEVDLAKRLDTGLFLDHRLIRERICALAEGKQFLNLFAYTGTASVYAAAGGAASTTTVDLSQVYLDWAKRNMEANGFSSAQHRFVKADVMRWITEARRKRERYDLIFVDPPTFSNSKSMGKRTWDVQRDHAELLIGVTHLLSEDGIALFSCNLRSFKPDLEKLAKYGVELEDISADTIPVDFARTPKIHKWGYRNKSV